MNIFKSKWESNDPEKRKEWIRKKKDGKKTKKDISILYQIILHDPDLVVKLHALSNLPYFTDNQEDVLEKYKSIIEKSIDEVIIKNSIKSLLQLLFEKDLSHEEKKRYLEAISKNKDICKSIVLESVKFSKKIKKEYLPICKNIADYLFDWIYTSIEVSEYSHQYQYLKELIIQISNEDTSNRLKVFLKSSDIEKREFINLILKELNWIPNNSEDKILYYIVQHNFKSLEEEFGSVANKYIIDYLINLDYVFISKREKYIIQAFDFLGKFHDDQSIAKHVIKICSCKSECFKYAKGYFENVTDNFSKEFLLKIATGNDANFKTDSDRALASKILIGIIIKSKNVDEKYNNFILDAVNNKFGYWSGIHEEKNREIQISAIKKLIPFKPEILFKPLYEILYDPKSVVTGYNLILKLIRKNPDKINIDDLKRIKQSPKPEEYIRRYHNSELDGMVETQGKLKDFNTDELIEVVNNELKKRQ